MADDPSSPRSFTKSSSRARDRKRHVSGGYDVGPKRLGRKVPLHARPPALQAKRRSILIVDGSAPAREAVAELLRDDNFTVHTASGMREMERVCRTIAEPPELALLEFHLSDGRGDRAAAWLRARWANLSIVYVSCSAPEHDGALEAALRAPATALLLKPTSLEAIRQAVARR